MKKAVFTRFPLSCFGRRREIGIARCQSCDLCLTSRCACVDSYRYVRCRESILVVFRCRSAKLEPRHRRINPRSVQSDDCLGPSHHDRAKPMGSRYRVTTPNAIPRSLASTHQPAPTKQEVRRSLVPQQVQSQLQLDSCGMDLVPLDRVRWRTFGQHQWPIPFKAQDRTRSGESGGSGIKNAEAGQTGKRNRRIGPGAYRYETDLRTPGAIGPTCLG
jgi:hypothetical protein